MFFQVLIICAKLVGLDGCFIKLSTGQQILPTTGIDGNNNIFPIAFGIVDKEDLVSIPAEGGNRWANWPVWTVHNHFR